VPTAEKAFESSLYYEDGHILQIRIWRVPEPVPPSQHGFKYLCFYGRPGAHVVLYDNERGKGDHRHYGELKEPYRFRGIEALMSDFLADVGRVRGEDE